MMRLTINAVAVLGQLQDIKHISQESNQQQFIDQTIICIVTGSILCNRTAPLRHCLNRQTSNLNNSTNLIFLDNRYHFTISINTLISLCLLWSSIQPPYPHLFHLFLPRLPFPLHLLQSELVNQWKEHVKRAVPQTSSRVLPYWRTRSGPRDREPLEKLNNSWWLICENIGQDGGQLGCVHGCFND